MNTRASALPGSASAHAGGSFQPTVIAIASSGASGRARITMRGDAVIPRLVERDGMSATVALVAGAALLLGDDAVEIRVVVGTGCTLRIEDVGGTVAYDGEGATSAWGVHVLVEDGATLLWAGLPFVVCDGAVVDRSMLLELRGAAIALIRETLVLGRDGERGGELRQRTMARTPAGPLFEEHLVVNGSGPVPGVLGPHRIIDSVLLLGRHQRDPMPTGDPMSPEDQSPDPVPTLVPDGCTLFELDEPGSIVRFLGAELHHSPLGSIWARWQTIPTSIGTP